MEARLTRLEEENAFLEHKLEGLHTALYEQQERMDKLERQLEKQTALLHELQESMNGGGPVNVPPPHYR